MNTKSGFVYDYETSAGLGLMALEPARFTEPAIEIQPVISTSRNRTPQVRPRVNRTIRPVAPKLPVIKRPVISVKTSTPVVRDLSQKPKEAAKPSTTKSEPLATQKKPINNKMIALAGAGVVGAAILLKILR